jgi:hypothetical protein
MSGWKALLNLVVFLNLFGFNCRGSAEGQDEILELSDLCLRLTLYYEMNHRSEIEVTTQTLLQRY